MHSPEQPESAHATDRNRGERNPVDFSHTPNVQVQVAVTPLQHFLLRTAQGFLDAFDVGPSSRDLAVAADVDYPTTCTELKALARLGVIEWGRTVRVVREPDGLFFAPRCGAALRDGEPEAASFCADGQGVAP
jgi:hypothetical protein